MPTTRADTGVAGQTEWARLDTGVSSSQSVNTEWMTPAWSPHYPRGGVHSMEIWAEKLQKKGQQLSSL